MAIFQPPRDFDIAKPLGDILERLLPFGRAPRMISVWEHDAAGRLIRKWRPRPSQD